MRLSDHEVLCVPPIGYLEQLMKSTTSLPQLDRTARPNGAASGRLAAHAASGCGAIPAA